MAAGFRDPGSVQASGFTVGGDKFFAIRADDRSLYGKKVCLDLLPPPEQWIH